LNLQSISENLFRTESLHYAAIVGGVILTTVSHLLLRAGASNKKKIISIYFDPKTIIGYSAFLLNTLLITYAMQIIELKTATAWGAAPYFLVILFAHFLFKESLTFNKITGSLFIALGVIFFSIT
jgi:drug/metabolite transporter (DMT)-like permease